MGDFDLDWGGDLGISPSGDYNTVDGDALSRQRVMRRLLSNSRLVLADGTVLPPSDPYNPLYGASLGRKVGSDVSPSDTSTILAFVRKVLRAEDSVNQTIPPTLGVTIVNGGVRLLIAYTSAQTGSRINLPTLAVS